MTFDEIKQKIEELVQSISESQDSNSEGAQGQTQRVAESVKALAEAIDEKFGQLAAKLDELDKEEPTMDHAEVLRALAAWKEQLTTAGLEVEVELSEGADLAGIIEALASVEVPSAKALQEENDALKTENQQLKTTIEKGEKEALAAQRLEDLQQAGIVIPESRLDISRSRLQEMDEEAYADYKQELLEFAKANAPEAGDEDDETFESHASYRRRLVTETVIESDDELKEAAAGLW